MPMEDVFEAFAQLASLLVGHHERRKILYVETNELVMEGANPANQHDAVPEQIGEAIVER